jgi:hypothetical protein
MFLICSQSQHEDIERREKFGILFEGKLVSPWGWWLSGIAPVWDPGTSREISGSNPLLCRGKPCWPSATELDLGLPSGLLVGSTAVFQKNKKRKIWEGSYTLTLYVLKSRCDITFASWFPLGKVHRWWTYVNCWVQLVYHLVLGPLFWECPILGLYPRHRYWWEVPLEQTSKFFYICIHIWYNNC